MVTSGLDFRLVKGVQSKQDTRGDADIYTQATLDHISGLSFCVLLLLHAVSKMNSQLGTFVTLVTVSH